METATSVCPACTLPILENFYFCPNCGKQLRAKALSVSVGKQIAVYLLSLLLPPLGLYPAFKYIRQPDPKVKLIGVIAIILTVVSIVLGFVLVENFMHKYSVVLDQLDMGQFTGY